MIYLPLSFYGSVFQEHTALLKSVFLTSIVSNLLNEELLTANMCRTVR